MNNPFVSIIIPCFNESRFIGQCLDSIIAGDYPHQDIEILIVDGGSNDETRSIVEEYSRKYPFVRTVNNPHRLKPHGLNIGIKSSKGDVIIRMDAHALYDKSYVSKSVHYLEKFNADNVGGIRKTLPRENSLIAKSIAESISNRFSAGNAVYRTGAIEPKWVDTVFGGCYRRETFEKIGLFNEALVRGQDREFNIRLQKAGGRILFAPDIICYYFARGTLGSYIPWIYAAGLTPFYVSRLIRKRVFSWRNFVPLFFVLSLIMFPILSLFHHFFGWLLQAEIMAYSVCAVIASVSAVKKERNLKFFVTMPLVFFLTHVLYGLGSLAGLVKTTKNSGEWTKV